MGNQQPISKIGYISGNQSINEVNKTIKHAQKYKVEESFNKNYENFDSESFIQDEETKDTLLSPTKEYTNKEVKLKKTIKWPKEAQKVLITGSFSNWLKNHEMVELDGCFEIELDLPIGITQFKFIVDDIWMCSNEYLIMNDGKGNFNNFIKVEPQEILNILVGYSSTNPKPSNISTKVKAKKGKAKVKQLLVHEDGYSCVLPTTFGLSDDPPAKLPTYKNIIDLSEKCTNYQLINNEEKSYTSIQTPGHIYLSHLLIEDKELGKLQNKVSSTSIITRYTNKYSTMTYYRPFIN